ncbi:hypothetical protein HNY73_000099 [Argiope bruennichi]|uniref:DUF5641 domain-containing protein n=1 Tax=Argiope bruennichi TaxID=94029 RepID=A0A8T0FWW6_ARGBR|nr:hypothetical protein HNY73_000099 [Argiope bruennichi]
MDDKSGRVRKKRGGLRTSVTKFVKLLKKELTKTDVNVDMLEEMLEQLAVESSELKNLDSQIEEFVSEDKLEKENRISGHLREFSKIRNESKIKEENIVLIGDSNVKRINWPLGRVPQINLGKDKKVRLVEVQTKSGSFLRPIQRLLTLEVSQSEKSAIPCLPKSDSPSTMMIPDGTPTSSELMLFQM